MRPRRMTGDATEEDHGRYDRGRTVLATQNASEERTSWASTWWSNSAPQSKGLNAEEYSRIETQADGAAHARPEEDKQETKRTSGSSTDHEDDTGGAQVKHRNGEGSVRTEK